MTSHSDYDALCFRSVDRDTVLVSDLISNHCYSFSILLHCIVFRNERKLRAANALAAGEQC